MAWLFLVAAALAADPAPAAPSGDIVPTAPDGVREVRWARPFTLTEPYAYRMSADQPTVTGGLIVELVVDPDLVVPAQTAVPVLYVGASPARTVNWDPVGGCLVAWAPGEIDLASTPIYFGSTELPERVDAARGAAELRAAVAAGAEPLPRAMVDDALAAGGPPLRAAEIADVFAAAGERVASCSPAEAERARNLGAP